MLRSVAIRKKTVTRRKTEEHPIFIGPIYIHDNSDFESYCHFMYHLKMKLVSTPLKELIIGSDDELTLVKAITSVFPEASRILCNRHLRQNTKQKLIDDAISLKGRSEILNLIYGDSDDCICFEEKCDRLERHCSEISGAFVQYFRSKLRPQLKDKVMGPATLHALDSQWTNNYCESNNHVL